MSRDSDRRPLKLKSSAQTTTLTSASSFLPAFLMRRLRTGFTNSRRLAILASGEPAFSGEFTPPALSLGGVGSIRGKFRLLTLDAERASSVFCRPPPPAEIFRRAFPCSENGATPDPPWESATEGMDVDLFAIDD